jgi:hypothetical protein
MVDCAILNSFMHSYIPDLYEHFMNCGFEANLNNFIYKWLVSLFIQNFPEDFSFSIWDYLFIDGNIVIFKASLAIFIVLKKVLMRNTNFETIYEILSTGTNDISDFHILLYYLCLKRFEFDYSFINKNRLLLYKPILDTIVLEDSKDYNMICNNKCDKTWPFCIDSLKKRNILSYLVLSVSERPAIFEDYFFMLCNEVFPIEKKLSYQYIPLERRVHSCKSEDSTIETVDEDDDEFKSKVDLTFRIVW